MEPGAVLLQEVPNVSRLVAPGFCHYANVCLKAALVVPTWLSEDIAAELSDSCYTALILHSGVALFSV